MHPQNPIFREITYWILGIFFLLIKRAKGGLGIVIITEERKIFSVQNGHPVKSIPSYLHTCSNVSSKLDIYICMYM